MCASSRKTTKCWSRWAPSSTLWSCSINACRRSGSARPSSFLAFFHDSLLPRQLASTTACFHDSLLPRQLASTTACFHDSLLPRQLASTTACFHDSLLPRQLAAVQGRADRLAAAPQAEALADPADQTAQGPAWRWISPFDGRSGCPALGGADRITKRCCDLRAKGGRPPVRRKTRASGPRSC